MSTISLDGLRPRDHSSASLTWRKASQAAGKAVWGISRVTKQRRTSSREAVCRNRHCVLHWESGSAGVTRRPRLRARSDVAVVVSDCDGAMDHLARRGSHPVIPASPSQRSGNHPTRDARTRAFRFDRCAPTPWFDANSTHALRERKSNFADQRKGFLSTRLS